ncbi:ABC transporter permease [Brooklawnia cerclae]|uniref:Spermidine/putrescine transport system permease protein n=1 Tax=Brooklawnia cerclae TaxID=349934 RepID=A0ABX0SCZ6_9ACTN|nr:ABC transporter permease [Brooklawnia cerclae]NIH56214.1 putative spermidine/putrescine transport system permease protein [Brooklawnia cerclae]
MHSRIAPLLLLAPGLGFLLVGFLVPSVAMLFSPPGTSTGEVFVRLGQMLTDPYDLQIIGRTLMFGLVVTVICVVLGFPVAYLLARTSSRWSGLLLALAIFPLLLSNVVRTFGWLVVLGSNGAIGQLLVGLGLVDQAPQLLYTPLAVVLGLTQLFLPLSIITCYSAVSQVDAGLDDAARGLGASRTRTFWDVVLPLSLPGIIVAATLVFAGSVTAYTTPYLLGGSSNRMLSTQLFAYSSVTVDWASASATAIIMTVLVFAVSALSSLAGRKGATA